MTEPNNTPKRRAKPFAVATQRGRVKALSSLSEFAIKSASTDSRVLSETVDPFSDMYGSQRLIEPKYDPAMLKELLYMNTYHARACKTKARDVAGSSWDIVDRDPDARKETFEDDLEEEEEPIDDVLTEDPLEDPAAPPVATPPTPPPDAPQIESGKPDPITGEAPVQRGTADPAHPALDPAAGQGLPEVSPEAPKKKNREKGSASSASPYAELNKELKSRIEEFDNPLVETMYKVWLDYESVGYGAFEIAREGNQPNGEISDLTHIPAETLRQHVSKKKYQQRVGLKTIWYKDPTYEGEIDFKTGKRLEAETESDSFDFDEAEKNLGVGLKFKVDGSGDEEHEEQESLNDDDSDRRATECVFIEQPDRVPDIIPAIPALYGDQSRTDYNISFFENYGVPSMMLLITGDYDPGLEDAAGVSEMEKFLEERLSELVEEPFSTLVVSIPTTNQIGQEGTPAVSIQAVPLSPQVSDASFRQYRQDNRDEILTANQVDPYRAQVIVEGQLGGSAAGEATEIYKQSTLLPKQAILEHRLNKYVVWDEDKFKNSKIEFAKIDTRDSSREVGVATTLFEKAAITPNEMIENFRESFNLGGTVNHPSMDLHYLAGKPIDGDDPVTPELEGAIGQVAGALSGAAAGPPAKSDPITGEPETGSAGLKPNPPPSSGAPPPGGGGPALLDGSPIAGGPAPIDAASPAPQGSPGGGVEASQMQLCDYCGREITGGRADTRFCSDEHRAIYWKKKRQ